MKAANESCRNWIKFERSTLSTAKKLLKKKRKKIKPTKAYPLIFQTSSEGLKVSTQLYQMENKELKMKLGMENFKMK